MRASLFFRVVDTGMRDRECERERWSTVSKYHCVTLFGKSLEKLGKCLTPRKCREFERDDERGEIRERPSDFRKGINVNAVSESSALKNPRFLVIRPTLTIIGIIITRSRRAKSWKNTVKSRVKG